MEFKDTLLMNKTNFEMKGNLSQKEPLLVEKWYNEDLYGQMNLNRKDAIEFVLHDGPPYANGDMHCGHMMNRILKDFVVRYKNMSGYKTPFVFGWDTHGLPIENQVTKSGVNRKTTPVVDFRKICEDYAHKQVERQKSQIKRLGLVGDFDHPYLTLNKEFEAKQLEAFASMALKGLIYKGMKPVHWSPSSESALAEAEIEYADVPSHSIYVAFKVKDGKGLLDNDTSLIIWTTTPWTLPGNLAISAHPNFVYGLYSTSNWGKIVILKEFEESLTEELGLENVQLIKEFKGSEMDGITTYHPFYDRESLVICGEHVTNDSGTGLVHTAPGFGLEDYVVCQKYHIEPYCPVDSKGILTEDTGERLKGLYFEDANEVVLQMLEENHALLKHTVFTHSYPHDWRTHKPLIFRATPQWFCSIDPIREDLIKAIHEVNWYPSWGELRMVNMIKERNDWCISRQRVWGVPIPIIYCEDGTPIIEKEVFDHIIELVKENGSNIWFSLSAKELLPEGYTNEHSPNGEFTKEKDIMDVWFDSGSSWNGVLNERGIKYPSDLYLEGSDQYRGWFNSSLIVSLAVNGVAPYKNVVSHGWVLDEHGEQMHKSKGNGVDPNKIANVYGADVLRLWTASVDYQQDVRIGDNLIKQVSEQYRKIRNTLKFISWNIADFDPKTDIVDELENVDIYILAKLEQVVNHTIDNFDRYDFASSMSEIMTFMSSDLSSFYLNIAKDTLYCDKKDSLRRRQYQTVLYYLGETLLRLLNPILPFTMDELNHNLPGERKGNVQLYDYPVKSNKYDSSVLEEYKVFNEVKDVINKALEDAKMEGMIKSSQEADITISLNKYNYQKLFDNMNKGLLPSYFVVSNVNVISDSSVEDIKVTVTHAKGHYCGRCRNYHEDAVKVDEETYLCPRCQKVVGEK